MMCWADRSGEISRIVGASSAADPVGRPGPRRPAAFDSAASAAVPGKLRHSPQRHPCAQNREACGRAPGLRRVRGDRSHRPRRRSTASRSPTGRRRTARRGDVTRSLGRPRGPEPKRRRPGTRTRWADPHTPSGGLCTRPLACPDVGVRQLSDSGSESIVFETLTWQAVRSSSRWRQIRGPYRTVLGSSLRGGRCWRPVCGPHT